MSNPIKPLEDLAMAGILINTVSSSDNILEIAEYVEWGKQSRFSISLPDGTIPSIMLEGRNRVEKPKIVSVDFYNRQGITFANLADGTHYKIDHDPWPESEKPKDTLVAGEAYAKILQKSQFKDTAPSQEQVRGLEALASIGMVLELGQEDNSLKIIEDPNFMETRTAFFISPVRSVIPTIRLSNQMLSRDFGIDFMNFHYTAGFTEIKLTDGEEYIIYHNPSKKVRDANPHIVRHSEYVDILEEHKLGRYE